MASCLFLHRLDWEPPLGLWSTKHLCRAHPRHHPSPHGESNVEGIAHRGADLVEAVRADAVADVDVVRVDGGMSQRALCSGSRRLHRTDSRCRPHRRHDCWGGPAGFVGTHDVDRCRHCRNVGPQVIVHPDDRLTAPTLLALGGGVISITRLDSRTFEPTCTVVRGSPRRGLSFFSTESFS